MTHKKQHYCLFAIKKDEIRELQDRQTKTAREPDERTDGQIDQQTNGQTDPSKVFYEAISWIV